MGNISSKALRITAKFISSKKLACGFSCIIHSQHSEKWVRQDRMEEKLRYHYQYHHNYLQASIEGASSRWMYSDSKASRRRSWAKSPPSLLLLRALRPGAAHPGDGFGVPGNVQLVLYSTHCFTRGVWCAGSHTPPHYTRWGRWEQPWTTKNLHVSHLLPPNYQQQKIQGLCPMHLLQRLHPHHL